MKKLIEILYRFVPIWSALFVICFYSYLLIAYLMSKIIDGGEITLPPARAMALLIAVITLISLKIASEDE